MLEENTLKEATMSPNTHLIKSVNKISIFSKSFDREKSRSHLESQGANKSPTSQTQQLTPKITEIYLEA